jgi:hypothetical protein
MKTIHTKLALAAVGIAMLATPALAQRPHHQVQQQYQAAPTNDTATYPNPAERTGSGEQQRDGTAFELGE